MDLREYDLMYQVEDRHWWYAGMSRISRSLLERWAPSKPLNILDAGCGTGAAMRTYLADFGTVTGIDLMEEALAYCRQRSLRRLARASVHNLPFANASFNLVTSFDVLYIRTVTDKGAALREFCRVLQPGGRLLVRLPAYNWLRGKHDDRVQTDQRYTTRQAAILLEQGGFRVEHLSYANTLLFPLAVLKRLSERFFPPGEDFSDLSLDPGPFNGLLRTILASEAPLIARWGLPFGLSVVAVGTKK